MTVLVGTMQLPVPQDADRVRDYLNGTIADGGLWTGLTRASDHDHTGGLNGKPISVSSIPDGSITTSKLDPSVLLPYALVDASKPFTGQVTMNNSAIIRDTLYFGAKPAGVADVTLQRTAAGALRLDTNLGLGITPEAWSGMDVLRVGAQGALQGQHAAGGQVVRLSVNEWNDGAASRAIAAGEAMQVALNGPRSFQINYAPSVAAGAALTFATRFNFDPFAGTLTLSPNAGQAVLIAALGGQAGRFYITEGLTAGTNARVYAGGALELDASANIVAPARDNAIGMGNSNYRWVSLYVVTAPVVGSSAELKEDITPLDPAACVQSVLDTDWVNYTYKAPPFAAPEPLPDVAYDERDDNETKAKKKARRDAAEDEARKTHAKMVVETALHRRQKGYVLGSPDYQVGDEFGLPDRENRSDGADIAVVACALQQVLRDLETVNARVVALETRPN